LPARRYASAGISRHRMSVRLSFCLSVTSPHSTKMAKRRITQTTPRDSPGSLVFWRQKSLMGDPHIPEICAQIDSPPFEHTDFDHSTLMVRQPWELAKNVQLALIGIRQRTFQRAIDEPRTLPPSHSKASTKRERQWAYCKPMRYKYSITARWKFCSSSRFINSRLSAQFLPSYRLNLLNDVGFFGILKNVCDIVVNRFTFAISSTDEFLFGVGYYKINCYQSYSTKQLHVRKDGIFVHCHHVMSSAPSLKVSNTCRVRSVR